ncbi:tetratricopeptide repeat protein [Streptomyces sp. NBC_01789]|uniref:tetratricopeptide repeat protein n=1 Tax=Streptomyces sp. NBC_01789 TaxID=2975941 RepID=UPI00225006E1|nr:tetratricopeptide repeat protein [Streptomyces sp. NBC_01789]MCX4448977.1 tetratricopeptide repeat protein [Streptomyces sp. NBC_01789]
MSPRPRRRKDAEAASTTARGPATPEQQISAADGAVAAGGNADHNAVGPGSSVHDLRGAHIHIATPEVAWPVEIGTVPGLASAFQPRSALRAQIDAAQARDGAAPPAQILSGGGGTGKSQLAASYAAEAIGAGTDLVVWADAGEVRRVVALYARAARRLRVPDATGEDTERDARALLSWLATSDRRWLVVLDDLTDPGAMSVWWPRSRTGTGRVLATTRLHDARITGNGRRRVAVDVYTPDEATAYLSARLNEDGAGHLLDDAIGDLAAALGHLPLALGHAAAYMLNQDLPCARYLALFGDSTRTLGQLLPEDADTEGYGREVAATLLLALDAAQRTEPAGLARPALRLAAFLEPAGHPRALWTTPAVLTYLTEHRTAAPDRAHRPGPVTAEQAEAALRVLHRYALVSGDQGTVRIHALTARAAREPLDGAALPALARAAADALLDVWPDPDHTDPELAASLRANSGRLHQLTGEQLWRPKGHEVLYRAGWSWSAAGLIATTTAHWEELGRTSRKILGPTHRSTLRACAELAALWRVTGRAADAITLTEQVAADCERLLGPAHRDTLMFRADLVTFYADAGREPEALTVAEDILAIRERTLGPAHAETLTARSAVAFAHSKVGHVEEALTRFHDLLADQTRILGPEHPAALRTRANLAASYADTGRTAEAIAETERLLADRERFLGPDAPDTQLSRSALASAYSQVGRAEEAVAQTERLLAGRERLKGPTHLDTLRTRSELALRYAYTGRLTEAIALEESVVADCERLLGPTHLDTLRTRFNLAFSYGDAGRFTEAVTLAESILADRERLLGPDHPETIRSRALVLALAVGQRPDA